MKLVLYMATVPSRETLEETSPIPPRLGLSPVDEPSSRQIILPADRAEPSWKSSWNRSFVGRLSLRTYLQPAWYSRGAVPSPTFSLQADSYFFRPDDLPADSHADRAENRSANYALFIELANAYYSVLRPVVGITFDEDHEPDVLYWEDAMAGRLKKLYSLTLFSPRFKNIVDPAAADGLDVHRVERLDDGGLLISLSEHPLSDDPAVRIRAEVELGFHPDVDPAEFRWRVARFDQALQENPDRLARELGLSPEDIERGRAASIAAGLPAYSFMNLLRRSAVENALSQARKPDARPTDSR